VSVAPLVCEAVRVALEEPVAVAKNEIDPETDALEVCVSLPVPVAVADKVGDVEGVTLNVLDSVPAVEGVTLDMLVMVAVSEGVMVPDEERDALDKLVATALLPAESVDDGLPVPEWLLEGVPVPVAQGEPVALQPLAAAASVNRLTPRAYTGKPASRRGGGCPEVALRWTAASIATQSPRSRPSGCVARASHSATSGGSAVSNTPAPQPGLGTSCVTLATSTHVPTTGAGSTCSEKPVQLGVLQHATRQPAVSRAAASTPSTSPSSE